MSFKTLAHTVLASALVIIVGTFDGSRAQNHWLDSYRDPASRLVGEALSSDSAWQRLALLGDTFGPRLSGSDNLADAIKWAAEEMKKDGLENVRTEPVKVPHWVRGQESAEIVVPRRHPMVMLGLGNSVGTPAEGIEAEILVVRNFQELDAAGAKVRGKIVVYNAPFTTYGETVQYPIRGTIARGYAGRSRRPRPVGGPEGTADAAHRRAPLRRRSAADPRRRDHGRRRRAAAADAGPRDAGARQAQDGSEVPA